MMDDKRSATKRLISYIEKNSLKRTFTSISEEVGIHEKTVRNIFSSYVIELGKAYQVITPKWLGIDEIHVIKQARCVMTNIEKQAIIDILPNQNKETVKKYLFTLPKRDHIQNVCMDMWNPYRDAVHSALSGRQIIVDKFHVVRMANQALETVRKSLRSKLTDRQRRTLVHDRFIILKRRRDLKMDEIIKLESWINNYPSLGTAYKLKEDFYGIWDSNNRQEAEEQYLLWASTIPAEMLDNWAFLLTAFRNWRDEIFAYFDQPQRITNAYTESINNVIRFSNRMGRGYSFDALRAKMLFSGITPSKKRDRKATKYPKKDFPEIPKPLKIYAVPARVIMKSPNYVLDISTLLKMIERGEI
jgi:transposase